MKCKFCSSENKESEIINGFCLDCYKKLKEDGILKNPITQKFKIIIYSIWFIGAIVSVLLACIGFKSQDDSLFYAIVYFFIPATSFYFSTLLLEAVAEIIQLLQNIYNDQSRY